MGEGAPRILCAVTSSLGMQAFLSQKLCENEGFVFFLSLTKDGAILNSALMTESSPECTERPDTRAGARRRQTSACQRLWLHPSVRGCGAPCRAVGGTHQDAFFKIHFLQVVAILQEFTRVHETPPVPKVTQ